MRTIIQGAFLFVALVLGAILFFEQPLHVTIPAATFMGWGASNMGNVLMDIIEARTGWK